MNTDRDKRIDLHTLQQFDGNPREVNPQNLTMFLIGYDGEEGFNTQIIDLNNVEDQVALYISETTRLLRTQISAFKDKLQKPVSKYDSHHRLRKRKTIELIKKNREAYPGKIKEFESALKVFTGEDHKPIILHKHPNSGAITGHHIITHSNNE